MKLSIIVPVYKVEPYLRRLLSDPALREKLRSSAGMSAVCSNEEKYRQLMQLCE